MPLTLFTLHHQPRHTPPWPRPLPPSHHRRAREVWPYAAYIAWLCSAVFLHLPSLEALGLEPRADLALALVAFCSAAAVSLALSCAAALGVLSSGHPCLPCYLSPALQL